MNAEELKQRTRAFSLSAVRLMDRLPKTSTADVLGRQLLRAGTSVGANYRAACRARSQADFISKIGIVEEEVDEAAYWLELLLETKLLNAECVTSLLNEAKQLTAIFAASGRTAKRTLR